MHVPLKKGDDVTIHFKSPDWPYGYASCTYAGQKDGKHIFESNTYSWKYIVDAQANTVICDENPNKVYELDNSTGWADRLSRPEPVKPFAGRKWFLELVQDHDGTYYANLAINGKAVRGLPEYVDYNTLRDAIRQQTGIVILKKKDMKFQQSGHKKYAYIDNTQERPDCRVTFDEMRNGWRPDFGPAAEQVESWEDMKNKYPIARDQMSECEEKLFVEDCFKLYEKEGFSPVYWSPYTDHKDRVGQNIELVGRCSSTDRDLCTLPMWKVRFPDGKEIVAYPEEVIPSEMCANGCRLFDEKKPSIDNQIQSAASRAGAKPVTGETRDKEPEL